MHSYWFIHHPPARNLHPPHPLLILSTKETVWLRKSKIKQQCLWLSVFPSGCQMNCVFIFLPEITRRSETANWNSSESFLMHKQTDRQDHRGPPCRSNSVPDMTLSVYRLSTCTDLQRRRVQEQTTFLYSPASKRQLGDTVYYMVMTLISSMFTWTVIELPTLFWIRHN